MPPTKSKERERFYGKITELEAELYRARAERDTYLKALDDAREQLNDLHNVTDQVREEREQQKSSARAYCRSLDEARAQNSELHRIIDEAKEILSRAIVLERRPPSLKNYVSAAVERIEGDKVNTFKIGLGKGWTCRNCAYYEPDDESLGECRSPALTSRRFRPTGSRRTVSARCGAEFGTASARTSAR